MYLATSPQYHALKLPIYLLSGLQWYFKQKGESHHLFYPASTKQARWYKNNGFLLYSIDPQKKNKEVPDDFHKSIFKSSTTKYCYQDGLQYNSMIVEMIVSNSSITNLYQGRLILSSAMLQHTDSNDLFQVHIIVLNYY